jgi:amino acid adenylation domain-containing protein
MPAAFVPFHRAALDRSIPERFAEQVARHSDRVAVRAGAQSITYQELGRKADRIARAILARLGPAAEPVALLFDQGASLVAATLGVLASGKFYVPLDPAYPDGHLLALLGDLRPRWFLTNRRNGDLARRLAPDVRGILTLDDIDAADLAAPPLPAVAADALAYVYFTSGSTGRAKGVMDTHRNVLHNIMRYTNSLRITADDRCSLVLPASSSGAVSDVFGALLNGAALFPVDLHHEDLAGLAAWINRERLTVHHSTPAIFRHIALSVPALPSLRVIRLEGDTASPRDVDLFRARCAVDSVLVNGLGLTECGLVRQYFVTRSTPVDAPVPVGYPVEDMAVALVDAEGREVPAGEIGEIVVESRFLAPGYWGRPDLTAATFATVLGQPGLRRYRTGDLGRLRPDGCLLHLGRTDFQPKVRGHRIDTEGIEAALLELSTMREAAVMVRADGPDDPRLVAYCVASATPQPTVSALRRHLTERLPRAMLPTSYVWLDRLPLTDSGKIDRLALPAPGRARPPLDTDMVAPRSPLEAALAQLWAEVLGLDEVGVDDNFFELGGDSLLAIQARSRLLDRLRIELPVRAYFEAPTIAGLAARIAGTSPADEKHGTAPGEPAPGTA